MLTMIAIALAGGLDKADAKATQALETCGEDEACRAEAVRTWSEKADQKGWTLPALIAEQQRLEAIAAAARKAEEERLAAEAHQAWLAKGQAALDKAMQRGSLPEALDALNAWVTEYGDHPRAAEIDAWRTQLVDQFTHRITELPWSGKVAEAIIVTGTPIQLRRTSIRRNQVTDVLEWYTENDLRLPATRPGTRPNGGMIPGPDPIPPLGTPDIVTHDGDRDVAIWEREARLAVLDRDRRPVRVFDLSAVRYTPRTQGQELVEQLPTWATVRKGVLYVSTSHRTYAETSHGENAYLTAFDVASGDLMWRSDPLVSNAHDFVVFDTQIVTGYGFSAEPDFIYVLDRATGGVESKIWVPTGPETFVLKDGTLYVRTYDRDITYAVE